MDKVILKFLIFVVILAMLPTSHAGLLEDFQGSLGDLTGDQQSGSQTEATMEPTSFHMKITDQLDQVLFDDQVVFGNEYPLSDGTTLKDITKTWSSPQWSIRWDVIPHASAIYVDEGQTTGAHTEQSAPFRTFEITDIQWKSLQTQEDTSSKRVNLDCAITKMDKSQHFSTHIWGEKSATVDTDIARRVKDAEVEIGTDSSTLGSAIGFKVVDAATGIPVSSVACGFDEIEDMKITTPIPGVEVDFDAHADNITQAFMNIEDLKEGEITNEEKRALFLLSYGGPEVNAHAKEYAMDPSLPLYFKKEGDKWSIVDAFAGKEYSGGEYGLVMARPRIESITVADLNQLIENDGEILLYRTMIAGVARDGTHAGGYWYADVLEKSNLILELITKKVCGGKMSSDEIKRVLRDEGIEYLINNVDHSSVGDSAKAVDAYVKVMIATSLDEGADVKEVKIPGYAALVKYDEATGFRLVRIYPV